MTASDCLGGSRPNATSVGDYGELADRSGRRSDGIYGRAANPLGTATAPTTRSRLLVDCPAA